MESKFYEGMDFCSFFPFFILSDQHIVSSQYILPVSPVKLYLYVSPVKLYLYISPPTRM